MKILITGFEPFASSDVNSSWEAAVRVMQMPPKGVNVQIRQIPVSFRDAGDAIRDILTRLRPDVLIMLGQRGKGLSIDIERIAVNLMDSVNSDNDGFCPQEQLITLDGKMAYFSNLPVKALRDALLKKNIPVKVSNSAGLYVCNSTYYNALKVIDELELPTKTVFVHLPKISDKFPIELLSESVSVIIETIRDYQLINDVENYD